MPSIEPRSSFGCAPQTTSGADRPKRCGARVLLGMACVTFASCSAQSTWPPHEHTERSQHAIESGELDEVHRSVFRVITRAGGQNGLCSATLVAPNLLLTARHCVASLADDGVQCATDHFAETTKPSELLFSNDTEPTLLSRWFAARAVLVNEATTLVCGNDVALVILDENVPASVTLPSEVRMDPVVVQDEPYLAVGYGGDAGDDSTAEYGVRRSRSDLVVECVGRNCGPSVTPEEFGGSGGGCPGDSGGPAFARDGRVLGALSRGHDECMSPVYSAASQFRPLLFAAAEQAAKLGDYPLPVWAGGQPPAPPDAGATAEEEADEPRPNKNKAIGPEKAGCTLTPSLTRADGWGLVLALTGLVALGRARRRQLSATSSIGTR